VLYRIARKRKQAAVMNFTELHKYDARSEHFMIRTAHFVELRVRKSPVPVLETVFR